MLRTILNKSWRQHPTRHQLYRHQPLITKTIQVRRTRHAGHCWKSNDELISDVLLWTLAYGQAKAGRPARTYIQHERLRDVALNTCQKRWMIGRSGERESGISVLAARHDDDDDDIKAKIDNMQQNRRCGLWGERDETVNYRISGCSKVAQMWYKTKHIWARKVIHWALCKRLKFDHTTKYCMHKPDLPPGGEWGV